MSTAAATEAGSWQGRDVSLSEVCRALTRLRRFGEDGPPMTLASVLTLVAVAPRPGDVPEMEGLIRSLAGHQPSRAIVLTGAPADPDGDSGIDAHVTTGRRPAGDERCIWVEMVTLSLRGATRQGAVSVVTPLLRYDLPTYLWWPGEPERRGSELGGLASLADRVITECGRGGDVRRGLRSLAAWATSGTGPATTDLAWAAITSWRQLLAQLLDEPSLARLRARGGTAAVRHPGAEPTAEALFLGGWLVDIVGGRLAVELRGGGASEGGVASLEVGLEAGRTLCITRPEGSGRSSAEVRVTEPDGQVRRRVLPLPARSRGELLAGELEVRGHDRSFERALPHAARLAAA